MASKVDEEDDGNGDGDATTTRGWRAENKIKQQHDVGLAVEEDKNRNQAKGPTEAVSQNLQSTTTPICS